eukprot:8196189-Pyramimonas_sp.AAC.1
MILRETSSDSDTSVCSPESCELGLLFGLCRQNYLYSTSTGAPLRLGAACQLAAWHCHFAIYRDLSPEFD